MRQTFGLFSNLIPLIKGYNNLKGRTNTKNYQAIMFEGIWDNLERKKVSITVRDNNCQRQ